MNYSTANASHIHISNSINLSRTKSLAESHSMSSKVGSTITNKGTNRSNGRIHHVYRSSSIKVRHSISKKYTSSLASNSNLSLSNKSRYSSSLEASRSNS